MSNIHLLFSTARLFSATFPSENAKLATNIKEQRCTPEERTALIQSKNNTQFLQDPDVQRKLLKSLLDGNIENKEEIITALEKCTPCITRNDQISIFKSRKEEISNFVWDQPAANKTLILKFLTDLPWQSESYIDDLQPHSESDATEIAFETVARHTAGTVQNVMSILDTSEAMQNCVPSLSSADQDNILDQLLQLLKNPSPSSNKKAMLLHFLTDISSEAQKTIASAIEKGKFGTDPVMLQALIAKLEMFTDPEAQRSIVLAIYQGRFGTNPAVLQALIAKLEIFTDSTAKQHVELAIKKGRFGTNPAMLKKLLNKNIGASINLELQRQITSAHRRHMFGIDPLARFNPLIQEQRMPVNSNTQFKIARAIFDGKLGINPVVLQAAAKGLKIFTYPAAQITIVRAIQEGRFGTDPFVLQALANNLGIFTDPEAQRSIASAIREGRFGTDPVVLRALAEKLEIFTDPETQRLIALAIQEGRFGTNPVVLQDVLHVLAATPVYSAAIISIMPSLPLTIEEKIAILRNMKFSLSLPHEIGVIPEQHLPSLFGAKAYLGSEVTTLLKARFPDIAHDAIDSLCDDDKSYALQINDQQLILYPLIHDQADFKGWMHPDHGVFYKQCIKEIKIADFSPDKLQDGYPTTSDGADLSPAHALFSTLPGYLQYAIKDNHFNLAAFQHKKLIEFVTDTLLKPLKLKNPTIAHQMQAIMHSSIAAEGNGVKIAQTNEEDAAIKDAINALCNTPQIREDSTRKVDEFFRQESISRDDKARLAVLFGTLAKKGVLGYHHGETNQANDLLYLLAMHCFHQLQHSAGITIPPNFHQELAQGACIEQLINNFIIANANNGQHPKNFHDVFAKIGNAA